LDAAISAAKKELRNPVVQLTSLFYGDANGTGNYIVVDAGGTDNGTAYTIKGLGKTATPPLTVGILLANDNVTLQDVNINITDPARAAITSWTNNYNAGVSIGRSINGTSFLANPDLASNKVTVKDSTITFNNLTGSTPFTAGIYINGRGTNNEVSITGNTISVTGYNDSATQAVLVNYYSPNYTITDNTLTATNTTATNAGAAVGAWNKPASALYIQIAPPDVTASISRITGNTLNGVFDFYVHILSNLDYTGIPSLFGDGFGTPTSIWATTGTDTGFYKSLLTTLLSQAKGGYGRVGMKLGLALSGGSEWVQEQYDINTTNGTVNAVDYWGPKVSVPGAYDSISDLGASTAATANRGRINVGGASGTDWHWTRDVTGSNFN
jgi:hypothetical protein